MEKNKIYPCVRCAKSTFKKKIAPKLKRWGYKGRIDDLSSFPILQTGYAIDMDSNTADVVGNFDSIDEGAGQYLCDSIPEFLEKAKELAIANGWFKEEADSEKASTTTPAEPMTWKAKCPISKLPPRLRRLAEYRKEHPENIPSETSETITIEEYQRRAMTTCTDSSRNYHYMMSNLIGEVGEFNSKVAKLIRKDNGHFEAGKLCITDNTEENERLLKMELGDILWQLAGVAAVQGWSLSEIAQMNLNKLASRKDRGTIVGDGDERQV